MAGLSPDPEKAARQRAALDAGRKTWPPPPAANRRALVHGVRASVANTELAKYCEVEIYDVIAHRAPLRGDDGAIPEADEFMIAMAADCLAQLTRARIDCDLHGEIDEKGNDRPASLRRERLRKEYVGHLERLLMTPQARLDTELMAKLLELEGLVHDQVVQTVPTVTIRRAPAIDVDSEEEPDGS